MLRCNSGVDEVHLECDTLEIHVAAGRVAVRLKIRLWQVRLTRNDSLVLVLSLIDGKVAYLNDI